MEGANDRPAGPDVATALQGLGAANQLDRERAKLQLEMVLKQSRE
jgi:hypothetical protein